MKKAHSRTITSADLAAAARLKALWNAMPNKPTQQAMADAWDGGGEANQSLISQYMTGKLALNYKAVLFFARQLGCSDLDIRSDLLEQRSRVAEDRPEYLASQPARLDPAKLAASIKALRQVSKTTGLPYDPEANAVETCLTYELACALGAAPSTSQVIDFGAKVAELLRQRAEKADGRETGEQVGRADSRRVAKQRSG